MSEPVRIPVVGDWIRLDEWRLDEWRPPSWAPNRYYEVVRVEAKENLLYVRYHGFIISNPLHENWLFQSSNDLLPGFNLQEIEKAQELIDSLTAR